MSKVITALSVSVDGYITGRDPGPGRGLGDGSMLFDWYFNGDTPSREFDGFRLSEASARVFDGLASRVGVSLTGRNTYDDSGWIDGGTPHPTAPLVVVSHRPLDASADRLGAEPSASGGPSAPAGPSACGESSAPAEPSGPSASSAGPAAPSGVVPGMSDRQTLVTSGIEDAVAVAQKLAGDKDVALMGGGVVSTALAAGLVDEIVLHQVPILLGGGRSFFQELPHHVNLRLVEAVAAPGVTHLHYEVVR
ncbi:dihydrofolate reductase family protein [Kribbella lupini]|uniref:Dihydrofolate reductase family protein n=1 Tax=Kribbella lupini TaxID=291602 RepID=A0ABP4KU10_9ACTN